jgi:NADPH-dependent 2,4-dienoyl-CoA reductase/sulfur reductase-like enzyme
MNAAVGRYAAVIGLGSMGMGMARALRRAGFDVVGCDANPAAVEQFVREGGRGRARGADRSRAVRRKRCDLKRAGGRSLHLVSDNGPGCLPAACGAARVRRAPLS